jgi:hypothetical protein
MILAHVPARLSNFCCRTHFVETWRTCRALFKSYQLFPETEEILTEKVRQWTFLYDTRSPDYRDQNVRANAWEGIGKELKIKRKFWVSSLDVRIVCPRLNLHRHRHEKYKYRVLKNLSMSKFKPRLISCSVTILSELLRLPGWTKCLVSAGNERRRGDAVVMRTERPVRRLFAAPNQRTIRLRPAVL